MAKIDQITFYRGVVEVAKNLHASRISVKVEHPIDGSASEVVYSLVGPDGTDEQTIGRRRIIDARPNEGQDASTVVSETEKLRDVVREKHLDTSVVSTGPANSLGQDLTVHYLDAAASSGLATGRPRWPRPYKLAPVGRRIS